MSTFGGKLNEPHLDFIRIDNFERKNYDGKVFFLSHFHSDHYKGLFDDGFANFINTQESVVLLCSSLTRKLILNTPSCKIPKKKIFPLLVNDVCVVDSEEERVTVIPIPAGHCPGSMMFFFQSRGKNILYTGDFRISENGISKFKALHDDYGTPLKISSLYLDTTFCDPNWLEFPTRDVTESDVLNTVRSWLLADHKNKIGIQYNSYFGLEYILIALARSCRDPIWIMDERTFQNYCRIPELGDAISRSESKSRVHLCPVNIQGNCMVCKKNRNVTKRIKPCALSFNAQQLLKGREKENTKVKRIAYSTHCSLTELINFVNHFSPEKIYPCVVRSNTTANKVLENLKLTVKSSSDEDNSSGQSKESWISPYPPKKRVRSMQVLENLKLTVKSSNKDNLSGQSKESWISPYPPKKRVRSMQNKVDSSMPSTSNQKIQNIDSEDDEENIPIIEIDSDEDEETVTVKDSFKVKRKVPLKYIKVERKKPLKYIKSQKVQRKVQLIDSNSVINPDQVIIISSDDEEDEGTPTLVEKPNIPTLDITQRSMPILESLDLPIHNEERDTSNPDKSCEMPILDEPRGSAIKDEDLDTSMLYEEDLDDEDIPVNTSMQDKEDTLGSSSSSGPPSPLVVVVPLYSNMIDYREDIEDGFGFNSSPTPE